MPCCCCRCCYVAVEDSSAAVQEGMAAAAVPPPPPPHTHTHTHTHRHSHASEIMAQRGAPAESTGIMARAKPSALFFAPALVTLKSSFWPGEKNGSNINMAVRGACSGGQGGISRTASQLLQTLWQDAAETVCGSMCVVDRRAGFLCRQLLSTNTSCTSGRSHVGCCLECWDDVCHSCCWQGLK
mgnify:CR=1 FL=1